MKLQADVISQSSQCQLIVKGVFARLVDSFTHTHCPIRPQQCYMASN
jgi:hypothetical protein